jgi:RNA polymerase sigma-70 factor (ECF subfamily)
VAPVGDPSAEPEFAHWAVLVEDIRAGQPSGMQTLYEVFGKGVRLYFSRQLGEQDVDDKVHDLFLVVVNAIRDGDLRDSERLMGFVRTIARRMVAGHIGHMVQRRRESITIERSVSLIDQRDTPEENIIDRDRTGIMLSALRELSPRDREILTRFYLHKQSPKEICAEMSFTATQFRLLKNRAKARFAQIGKNGLAKTHLLRSLPPCTASKLSLSFGNPWFDPASRICISPTEPLG